jgi:hypothetical protein
MRRCSSCRLPRSPRATLHIEADGQLQLTYWRMDLSQPCSTVHTAGAAKETCSVFARSPSIETPAIVSQAKPRMPAPSQRMRSSTAAVERMDLLLGVKLKGPPGGESCGKRGWFVTIWYLTPVSRRSRRTAGPDPGVDPKSRLGIALSERLPGNASRLQGVDVRAEVPDVVFVVRRQRSHTTKGRSPQFGAGGRPLDSQAPLSLVLAHQPVATERHSEPFGHSLRSIRVSARRRVSISAGIGVWFQLPLAPSSSAWSTVPISQCSTSARSSA